ncbi:MAG TPA: ATP-binding protein [Candidatus Binatia bacterium]|jgi:signal transduction histidine kinase
MTGAGEQQRLTRGFFVEHPDNAMQSARWFGTLTRTMDVGVVLLTVKHELEFANGQACALLGYDNPEDLRQHWAEFQRLLQPGLERKPSDYTTPVPLDVEISAGGNERKLRFEIYRLDEDTCDGVLVLIKNRAVLDAVEGELALAIQMRALARYLMEVVHDLRAPLNAMVINLELLKDALPDDRDIERVAKRQRYIGVLGDEVQRLNRALTALLSQTPRPGEGAQRFDLRTVVEELAALLGPLAKAQRAAVETALPPDALEIEGRRDRVKQALLNVAINAIEAMPDGGTVRLALERQGGEAHLSVRDEGPGIPEELMSRIYAMHFTTKSGGTGIGLYVAQSVVLAHQGTIRIESVPGAGTTVHITLPLATD